MSKYISSVISKPFVIDLVEKEIPEPALGEALIKINYAAICGTDMHIFQDKYPAELPKVVGHESSGQVVKINATDGTPIKAGDRVSIHPFLSCGHCDACITGHSNVCETQRFFGTKTDGIFTEYAIVPARNLVRIEDNVDQRLACLTEPLAVGVHAVRESGLQVGETALVMGAGPIGLIVGLVLRMAGAVNVVLTDISQWRLDFAESLGFKAVNVSGADVPERLLAANGGSHYHKIFEATGVRQSYETMFKVVKARGTIIILGLTNEQHPFNTSLSVFQEATVKAMRIHSLESFRYAARIMGAGRINEDLEKLITHEYEFKQITEAMKFACEDQEHIKVIMRF